MRMEEFREAMDDLEAIYSAEGLTTWEQGFFEDMQEALPRSITDLPIRKSTRSWRCGRSTTSTSDTARRSDEIFLRTLRPLAGHPEGDADPDRLLGLPAAE